jgi:undecaprenyl-diphosphatase
MSWWQAIILGIVQGASEFLPVSSSGHLLLLEKSGVGNENLFFNIMLHVGTLAAVLVAMRKTWRPLLRHPKNKTNLFVLIACIPTVLIALVFKHVFPELIEGQFLALGFMLSAVLIFCAEKLILTKNNVNTIKTSALTGVIQGIAVLPGISRSGATISAMRLLGIEKEEATSFSFLLSIPIILGSAVYESISLAVSYHAAADSFFNLQTVASSSLNTSPNLADAVLSEAETFASFGGVGLLPLVLGMLFAFGAGLLAVNGFLKLVKKHSMLGFAFYDAAASVLVLVLLGLKLI